MSLNPEWLRRLNNWRDELQQHFYRPLGTIALYGYVTEAQLTADEALSGPFEPMPSGTRWGAKWEYGWFKGAFALPPEAAGHRIVVRVDAGGESIVWVNGHMAGAKDRQHTEITVAMQGEPGAHYDILVEAYAGHGLRSSGKGPVGYGRESVPEPPPTQTVVGQTTFGIWNEAVYQLWLDVETLLQTRNNLDPNSLRVAEIDAGLKDFTLIADPELPPDEFLATVEAARARLKSLLACVNGSTAPTLYAIGHAHIDVAWLWPLQETERKMARTISSQLALMKEYPEFKFIQSQPHLYYMLQKHYPAVYREVKAAVAAGKIIPEGGMWIEADTNVSGGEALIRQFVRGKQFFKREFGVENELLWLPDVFGYSGAMPQIMQGCGIKYFATQKIFWGAYTGGDPFPYNTFTWEGIDGSEVLAHIFNDYNSVTDPNALAERWRQRVQKDGISTILLAFGYGDGGGGPTRNHLEYLRRAQDLEGLPKVHIASPIEFFEDQVRRGIPQARYVGELYFQAHRGTYTSQAKTKKNNRRAELALREAELWGAAARALADASRPYAIPAQALEEAWRTVLLNQFHDILPGSSIHRVYEEAEASHAEAIRAAQVAADDARAALVQEGEAITVFNSLSWPRQALVSLPAGAAGATDAAKNALPVQATAGRTWAEVSVPSCGWTTVHLTKDEGPTTNDGGQRSAVSGRNVLENEYLRLQINEFGELTSIFDKEAGRELAAGACNSFKLYKDVPGAWDAWDIDSMYTQTPVELPEQATIEVVAEGPLVATLRVTRTLHTSAMTQEISLRRGSRRVDFATTIDWQESHKMLKVAFPVDIHANEAIHEIQFGHIRRPNHTSRPYDADRFEVCNHKWSALAEESRGCAVLNNSKYGLNVRGNTINLTLLKSALAPDMTADKGVQTFTYSFYAWDGSLADSAVVREGYELNVPVTTAAGQAGARSLFGVDAANVIIETVKPAEDGLADVIVRLYEAKRTATRVALTTALPAKRAALTNMLEEFQADLPLASGTVLLQFRPFEIKTVRFTL